MTQLIKDIRLFNPITYGTTRNVSTARRSIFSTIVGGFFVFQPATSNLKGLVIIYKTTHNLDEIHSLTLLLMGLLEIFPQVGEAFFLLLLVDFLSFSQQRAI